jgi:hypothetical protein
MTEENGGCRMVLLTNIRYVTIGKIRCHAHAMLLEHQDNTILGTGPRDQMRLFGADAAWAVMDMELEGLEYEEIPAASPHIFIGGGDKPRPLANGYVLRFSSTEAIIEASVMVEDYEKPLYRDDFEIPPGNVCDDEWSALHYRAYDRLWNTLRFRVAEHWTAPYMPTLNHLPKERVREAFGAALARASA